MSLIDATKCPLCQSDNFCGVDQSRCWCMNYTVDSRQLEQALAEGVEPTAPKSCVCEVCLASIADLVKQPCSIQRNE